jgi:hypothetical protein
MAQTLTQISIEGPGSQGLNSEISPFQQSVEFALKADNAVIDRVGRLAAREAFADYIKTHNIPLAPGEEFEIVRMEVVQPDKDRPVNPTPLEVSEYNVSEFNSSEFSGVNLAREIVEAAPTAQYNIGQFNIDEYSGTVVTENDENIVFGIAGIRRADNSFDAEYNVSKYNETEYSGQSPKNSLQFDRYIGFVIDGARLRAVPAIQPSNGLTKCQLVAFQDSIFVFSKGDAPMVYHKGLAAKLSDHPDYLPPQDNNGVIAHEIDGDIACAAYGRLWVSGVNGNYDTIYYSDLLVPHQWYDGTDVLEDSQNTAGIIDVREYWPSGNDKIQGIAAHNGFLLVFGRHSILIYSGAQGDPAGENGLQLQDAIRDVGLVNQDAMCNIGSDHLFVDSLGVRSLGRVVQEKSTPIAEPSLNVATVIREQIAENRDTVRLSHLSSKSIAICLFPKDREAYAFQLGQPGMTGGLRATRWTGCDFFDGVTVRNDYKNRELLGGRDSRGCLMYFGYSSPAPYQMEYESTTLLGGDALMRKMVPKSVSFSYKSEEANNLVIRWGFGSNEMRFKKTVKNKVNAPEFTTNKVNLGSSGEMLRVGFNVTIDGNGFSMQNVSVNTLVGRLIV